MERLLKQGFLVLGLLLGQCALAQSLVVTATASSSDGNGAVNLLDNNLSTRWSANGVGQYVDLSFSKLQNVSRVRIAFYKGNQRIQKFRIAGISAAGTLLGSQSFSSSGASIELQDFNISAASVRGIRIIGDGNSVNTWNSLTEVKIVSTDVAPTSAAIASISASSDDGNIPSNVLDKNLATRWSANGVGQFLDIRFVKPQDLSAVRIAFYGGTVRTQKFRLVGVTSIGAFVNETPFASSGTTDSLQSFGFNSPQLNGLRIIGDGNSINTWNSLTEVEVASVDSPVIVITKDVTPPVIMFNTPAANAIVSPSSNLEISILATDNVAVQKVSVAVNGVEICLKSAAPYTCSFSVPAGYSALYKLTASATDTSGNVSSVSESVTSAAEVIQPPLTTSDIPVYPGCEAPAASYTRTLYADPVNGLDSNSGASTAPLRTLAGAFAAHKIQPGDRIIAKAGNHGILSLSSSSNPELVGSTKWISIEGEPGAVLARVSLTSLGRILISKFDITSSGYTGNLVSVSRSTNIVFADSSIYSAKDTSAWTAANWMSNAASGVGVSDGSCTAFDRNVVKNVRFGMVAVTSNPLPPANRLNALFQGNTIQYYSADGFRPNASNVLFKNNRILDVLVSDVDGDENHDDAIQGFSLGTWGAINFENVVIEGNWVQESTNPATKFRAQEQGISVFDGLYTNIAVRNNVVICSSWHGIMLMGPDHGVVENNTVVGIDPRMTTWASISDSKTDAMGVSHPAIASVIRNNIAAAKFGPSSANVTVLNNYTITAAEGSTNYLKYDLSTQTFDPHLRSTSSVYGKGAGVYP